MGVWIRSSPCQILYVIEIDVYEIPTDLELIAMNQQVSKGFKRLMRIVPNINQKTITTPNIALSRDLHCWDFKFLWYPTGHSKGFRLKINIKNPDLQDIKVRSTSPGFKN